LKDNYDFLKAVVDATMDSMVVIQTDGSFVFTNKSWHELGRVSQWFTDSKWQSANYLTACDVAAAKGDHFAAKAAKGIRKVSRAEQDVYYLEYPCDGLLASRWFVMRVTQFSLADTQYLVISHHDITARKLAEQEATDLAHLDDLTGISNRRRFEEFLSHQWRRSVRMKTPISLAMIDIDHFKQVNDTYGHGIGARYGGEEFTILLGSTDSSGAMQVIEKLLKNVRNLKIPNENASTKPTLTLSIGLATIYPDKTNEYEDLLLAADKLLYSAKTAGRDTLALTTCVTNTQMLDITIISA
jgi:GGDEF domain-containing protein